MPTPDEEPPAPPTGKPKPAKSANAVVSQRVGEILRIRLDGANLADIRDYAGEKGWDVSDSMLKKHIEKADVLLKDRHDAGRARAIRLGLARRESLYARAVQAADYRTALAVLDSESKLRGLFPVPDAGGGKAAPVPLVTITTDDGAPAAPAAG